MEDKVIKLHTTPEQTAKLIELGFERTDGNILLPHNNLDYICTHLRSSDVTCEDNYGCFSTYELALEDALAYSLKNLV